MTHLIELRPAVINIDGVRKESVREVTKQLQAVIATTIYDEGVDLPVKFSDHK